MRAADLEREVAALLREHVGIGYSLKHGLIVSGSLFIVAEPAASIVVRHVLAAAALAQKSAAEVT